MKRVLNYVGSKWNLASWIVNQMPEHKVYLEPFFGSGAVLFNKQVARIETINDLDGNIVNLFKVIRDQPAQLAQQIQLTPYSRQEYNESITALNDELNAVERARVFLVRCWMARGGKTSDRTGWRHNVDSTTFSALPDWRKLPAIVLEATERLKHVKIENLDAVTLIRRYNKVDCLIYSDPPYLLSTRTKRHYAYEMTDEQHETLLRALNKHRGFAMLSGYNNDMYNDILQGWTRISKMAITEAAKEKCESLWLNPRIIERGYIQESLFETV
ncbi:DNA adenine methylase [Lysinibacillus sphaericus]|uniref:DNA adenine methylase n=1 Tax=Lysinibacillus sphaericus TaxID=1421 RepID=UPI002163748C|nr:DNA adenine methylase [Lysinibacillus sphaericus]MCS1383572.1 DNA adenine methylase [Lysinibacillus sphaericus]